MFALNRRGAELAGSLPDGREALSLGVPFECGDRRAQRWMFSLLDQDVAPGVLTGQPTT